MKLLITGGAGFIGSNLAAHLLAKGHKITIFDDLSAGRKENVPKGCVFVEGDIRDKAGLEKVMEGRDAVVHLAAEVSVPKTIEHPELVEEINVRGTKNVLEAAFSAGVTRAVIASSAAVYGESPTMPTKEDHPFQPLSPYASSKIKKEEFAEAFSKKGLPTCCLRFFNVYGPRQDPKSQYSAAIPKFIDLALRGEPITIYGDGLQTRDFIYVEDVARAITLALEKGQGIYNIATGKSVTIKEVAEMIVTILGSNSRICHAPSREGDPRTSLADVSKAKEELGFEAETRFEDGLRKTIEFYKPRT